MKQEQCKKKKSHLWIKLLEWILTTLAYTLVLILMSALFSSFYIDPHHYGLYALLVVVVIYLLNKTVKPILFSFTLPITGITLGLFYPCLNLFVLKLTDWILGSHFQIYNIWVAFFIAILISLCNSLMEEFLIKPITRRLKKI